MPAARMKAPIPLSAPIISAATSKMIATEIVIRKPARTDGKAVVAQMKAMPCDDDAFGPATIRDDGRYMCPAYLFQVKSPAESKAPWDYYKLLESLPADKIWRPMSEGGCSLVKT